MQCQLQNTQYAGVSLRMLVSIHWCQYAGGSVAMFSVSPNDLSGHDQRTSSALPSIDFMSNLSSGVVHSGGQHEFCNPHVGDLGIGSATAVHSPGWPASLLPWQLVPGTNPSALHDVSLT